MRLLIVLLMIVLPCVAQADEPQAGIRVRLTAPEISDRPLIGTLTALETDSVSLSLDGESTTVPMDAITRVELSRGKHSNAGKGAIIGLAIGAALGAVGGAAIKSDDFTESKATLMLGFGAFYGAMGAGIGALIGMAIKTERWEEVDQNALHLTVIPVPGGVGVAVRWSF